MDLHSRVTLFLNKVSQRNVQRLAEEAWRPESDGELAMNLGSGDPDVFRCVADSIVAHSLWSGLKHSTKSSQSLADVIVALDSCAAKGTDTPTSLETLSLSSCVIDAVTRGIWIQLSQPCGDVFEEQHALKVRECAKAVARLVGQLFSHGCCPLEKFQTILAGISRHGIVTGEATELPQEPERCIPGLPQCALLSGRLTRAQPRSGETVADFKDRLATELQLGPAAFFFLAGGREPRLDEEVSELGDVELLGHVLCSDVCF